MTDQKSNWMQKAWKYFKDWLISSPIIHSIHLILYIIIAVSSAIMFFIFVNVYTFSSDARKALVLEINNELTNISFTLLVFLELKFLIIHSIDAVRYNTKELKAKYSWVDNKWYFLFAMINLDVSCITQVVMTVLMWVYPYTNRPDLIFTVCVPVSVVTFIIGFVYVAYKQWVDSRVKAKSKLRSEEELREIQ